LRDYVLERGLGEAVEFRGHVSEADKHAAYDEAWVLALPSLKEGWGLVVGEAAAHGVPAVAYRKAGGPTESVHDGHSGILVDDHAGFCTVITSLLQNEAARTRLSAGATETAGHFTWAATVNSFDRVLSGQAVTDTPDRPLAIPEAG
jgi:glycosyltransferase involved in cell wall biosynthesis